MTFIPSQFQQNYKLMFIPLFAALAITICIILSVKHPIYYPSISHTEIFHRIRTHALNRDQNSTGKTNRSRGDEIVYNVLSNASRTLIAMEIRARRLEDNIKRVRERTRTLLWKNKDKSLWRILFKNISRNVAIRHEFHEHSSLKRILEDEQESKLHINKHEFFDDRFDTKDNEVDYDTSGLN